ncbi:MAG: hypothetical protein V1845_02400 [bacterium]
MIFSVPNPAGFFPVFFVFAVFLLSDLTGDIKFIILKNQIKGGDTMGFLAPKMFLYKTITADIYLLDTGSGRNDKGLKFIGEVEISQRTRSLIDALCSLNGASEGRNLLECIAEITTKCIALAKKK